MFGFCQNKEIIHQHHHHFHQILLNPVKSRTLSIKQSPQQTKKVTLGMNQTISQQRIFTSKLYSSKNKYQQKKLRGIHLSFKEQQCFQIQEKVEESEPQQNFNLSEKNPVYNLNFEGQQNDMRFFHNKITQKDSFKQDPLSFHIMEREQIHSEKRPSITFNALNSSFDMIKSSQHKQVSKATSLTQTTKLFKNSHQLTSSKIHINIPEVKKGQNKKSLHHNLIPKSSSNKIKNSLINYNSLSLSDPINNMMFNHSENVLSNEKNRKERILMKKVSLYDDAKSIISDQNMDMTHSMNIQESLILNHEMDYFQSITEKISYKHYDLCLAIDKNIGFLVSLKIFQRKNQCYAHEELNIISMLDSKSLKEVRSCTVQLYRVLTQGSGMGKSMIFVCQPYEMIMIEFITKKKQLMRRNHVWYYQFLTQFEYQIKIFLLSLSQANFSLTEPLCLSDLVVINNRYKFNSIYKLRLSSKKLNKNEVLSNINLLKLEITNQIRS